VKIKDLVVRRIVRREIRRSLDRMITEVRTASRSSSAGNLWIYGLVETVMLHERARLDIETGRDAVL
jgi:hypothetical protein